LLLYSAAALEDLDRLARFLLESDPGASAAAAEIIKRGLDILKEHPLVGRFVAEDSRELVISRGSTGYVALYRYNEDDDTVTVLGIRHQRESGFGE
jgi:plasmid stabilization system protein ParE